MSFIEDLGNDPIGAIAVIAGAVTGQYWLIAAGLSHVEGQAAAGRAKRDANDALQPRTQMIKSATAVRRIVYGRASVSGPMVYAQSTGSKSEVMHVVVALAGHESDAIEQVWFGESLLPVASGPVTSGFYYLANTGHGTMQRSGNGTLTLPFTPTRITGVTYKQTSDHPRTDKSLSTTGWALAGNVVTVTGCPSGGPWTVTVRYEYDAGTSVVTLAQALGLNPQTAFAGLVAESGGKWTANHKLNGITAIYARLVFNQDLFGQVGIPNISAVVRGKKVWDPRENRLLWSDDFTQAAWTKGLCTVTAGAALAPDGTMTMTKLVETATTGIHDVQAASSGVTYAVGQLVTVGISVKAAERTAVGLGFVALGAFPLGAVASFNLTTGTLITSGNIVSYSIYAEANGCWRIQITAAATAAGAATARVISSINGTYSFLGVAGSGVYIWRAQVGAVGHKAGGGTKTTGAVATAGTRWSQNWALCVADYLRSYLGAAAAEIIDAELGQEADICDQWVAIDATGTNVQPRYTVNGVLSSDSSPRDNLDALLSAGAGSVTWVQGRWRILSGYYRTPTMTINEDYLADDAVEIAAEIPRSSVINRVTSKYTEPTKSWTVIEAPPQTSATYVTEDGGADLPIDVTYPMVTDSIRAQRLSKIKLDDSRNGLTCRLTTNMRGYDAAKGDVVYVTLSRYGWNAKTFVVIDRKWSPKTMQVAYTLKETSAAIWNWNYGMATTVDLTPNTTLPNAITPPAVLAALTATSGTAQLLRLADGSFVTRALITWTQASEMLVVNGGKIEIQWCDATSDQWNQLPVIPGSDISAYIGPLSDTGVIYVRARAINVAGRSGPWSTIMHTVVGLSAAPSAPTGLAATTVTGGILLSWTAQPEPDYHHTELRQGASWAAGTPLKGTLPNITNGTDYLWPWPTQGSYTVWATHYDTTGNPSAAASLAVTVGTGSLLSTGNSQANFATDVISTYVAGPVNIITSNAAAVAVATINYIAPVDCTITITASGNCNENAGGSQFSNWGYIYLTETPYISGVSLYGASSTYQLTRNVNTGTPVDNRSFSMGFSMPVVAGRTYVMTVYCQSDAIQAQMPTATSTVSSVYMRVEAVKR